MVKDLTTGKESTVLLKFTLPLFVSVIFQQMYNIADSIIAGKFAGENALAAVGASYPVTMIFMAVAFGCNVGCAVIISQLFGAKKFGKMKTAVSTTIIATLALAVMLTVAGLKFCSDIMNLIHTPEDIFKDGELYLKIYIGGLTFLFLYNVATGIFTSLGDSKTPLYFLIGSSVGNVVLDYVFVVYFKMGVAGVAWATFIAQSIACVLAVVTLFFRMKSIKTDGENPVFSIRLLQKIAVIAIPSILQQSFVSVGNIFIQSLINGYGSSVIAGYSAAIKLNTFAIMIFCTLGNGLSSFTAQNIGAGKYDRVKKGYRSGIVITFIAALPFFLLYFFSAENMVSLFLESESAEALNTGVDFLRYTSPFYFLISIKLLADGLLRGAGAIGCFMVTTFSDLILRVILANVLSPSMGIHGIWTSWPIGWIAPPLYQWLFITPECGKTKRLFKVKNDEESDDENPS